MSDKPSYLGTLTASPSARRRRALSLRLGGGLRARRRRAVLDHRAARREHAKAFAKRSASSAMGCASTKIRRRSRSE